MRRWMAAVLGLLMVFALAGCAPEEPGWSLTAVGIDTCTGVVTDRFLRGDGEVLVTCIEVDTGSGEPRLFALPEESTPDVAAEVAVGDTVQVESDSGDEVYRTVRGLVVTEHSPVLTEPPALIVSTEMGNSAEAQLGTFSWSYREGQNYRAIEGDAASPLEWAELPALALEPAEMPQDMPIRAYLRFDHAPDTVEAAYWDGDCRGQSGAESTELPVAFDEDAGCFFIEPLETDCIYEVCARWEERPEGYDGTAWYAFCTELPVYTP